MSSSLDVNLHKGIRTCRFVVTTEISLELLLIDEMLLELLSAKEIPGNAIGGR